ncbi:MAG: LPXTG cell wall anchor domain-containing protein [Eubacteriales bacterium]|nr:LPXTG cell wall anchor domain-containing protein [Eubacteriales bacterium]
MKWRKKRKLYRKRILTALAILVVFVTTYALIIPAITIDDEAAKAEPGLEVGQLAEQDEAVDGADVTADDVAAEAAEQTGEAFAADPVSEQDAAPEGEAPEQIGEPDADSGDAQTAAAAEDADPAEVRDSEKTADGEDAKDDDKDQDPDKADESKDKDSESKDVPMPAMKLTSELDGVKILVEVDEGSLPEGTTLKVTPVEEGKVLDKIEAAVDEKIGSVRAFDICFLSPEGEELEPLKPVRVSMTAPDVTKAKDTVVVHVEDETMETTVVDQVDEETGEDEIVFEAKDFSVYGFVFTQQLTASVLTSEGESYTVTVNLDENSGIPEDAELAVSELLPGSEEYEEHLQEAKNALSMSEDAEIAFARFFDIQIRKDGEKLEPATPAKVELTYNDPLQLEEGQNLNVVHFADAGIEVIDDLEVNEEGTQITYEQSSFSVTGTIIQGTLGNGQKGMIIIKDNGSEYIVLSDGTLEDVTQVDWDHFKTENPMVWKYTNDTYYHETRAYDFASNQIASDFYYSYINAKEADGIGDDDAGNINPEHPLNQPVPYGVDGRRIGDWSHRNMWPASATILENHHMRNRDPENGQYYYIGVERGPDGKPKRITGRNSLEDAAEIYLATTELSESDLPSKNRVNHIDISIKGTTSIVYPLTRGVTYYYKDEDGSLYSYTPTEKTTVTLTQEVGIKTDDMRNATISAFTKDGNIRHPIDDVFYITGYSANAETQYSTDQVRIEGSFKVTTTDSTNWNERIKPENRIYYSVEASKLVDFYVKDPDGRQLYNASGQPITVKVNVNLNASFDYWDERNECPPVQWTRDSWRQGDIMSHGLSGMDFVLGADANLNTLEIIKYVEDEQGNIIELRSGTELGHEFGIYQRVNGQWREIDTKTAAVSEHGIGFTSEYGVPDGSYVVREKTDSIPNTIVDKNGDTWIYSRTYFETEGANRRDWPNEHDRWGADPYLYESESGGVGASNRDVQFTCHNIYRKKISVTVEKKWYQDGEEINAPENAEVMVTLGRYVKQTGDEPEPTPTPTPDPSVDPTPTPTPMVMANIDIYRNNYGHQTLVSDSTHYNPGQTLRITLNKQKQANVSYSVNGGAASTLPIETNNGERQDYWFEVVIPADGILQIALDDAWSDVQNIRLQAIAAANARRRAAPTVRVENVTWTTNTEPPEEYQIDSGFAQPILLPEVTAEGKNWSRTIRNLDAHDANGNEYLYFIAKVEEKNVPEGTVPEVQTPLTTTGHDALVVNNNVETTTISFTKQWYGADLKAGADWPDEISNITVELARYYLYENGESVYDSSFKQTAALNKNGLTDGIEYAAVRDEQSKGYIFTITKLGDSYLSKKTYVNGTAHEWIYTIKEDSLEGYHIKYIEPNQTTESGADFITNGGTIENHLDVYQLPHTGGPGTWIYTLAGGTLVLIALCFLLWRQRRERRSLF